MTVHEQNRTVVRVTARLPRSSFRGVTRLSEVSARTEPPGRHRLFSSIRHLKPAVVVCGRAARGKQATAPVCSEAFSVTVLAC